MPFFRSKNKSKRAMRDAVGKNMKSLHDGPHHKDRTQKQELAISYKKARGDEGRKGKRKGKRTSKRKLGRKSTRRASRR